MIHARDDNFVVRTLPSPDTNGGDRIVDRYGNVWRVLPPGCRPPDGTGDRRGTLHTDGRITEP